LQSHGIEVRHALPGVGEGLQDHYAPRSVARVKNIQDHQRTPARA
jgi:choline dehydrogenase